VVKTNKAGPWLAISVGEIIFYSFKSFSYEINTNKKTLNSMAPQHLTNTTSLLKFRSLKQVSPTL
jgi:hypothetical protein